MGTQTGNLVIGGTVLGIVGIVVFMVLGRDKGPIDDPNVPPISRATQAMLEANLSELDKEPRPSQDRHVGSFSMKAGKRKRNKRKSKKSKKINKYKN